MSVIDIHQQIEQYHKECYSWALHCCGDNRDMAFDVIQSAYLKMLEKRAYFNQASSFKTWAFSIIRNTAIDAFRQNWRRSLFQRRQQVVSSESYDAKMGAPHDDKITQEIFRMAIEQLSNRQKQIMHLVFYHDLTLDQTASVLKISCGAVRKHYDRAKKALAIWFTNNASTTLKAAHNGFY
jgi:RNA polymerase sigma-70 factor, ECF subfamily